MWGLLFVLLFFRIWDLGRCFYVLMLGISFGFGNWDIEAAICFSEGLANSNPHVLCHPLVSSNRCNSFISGIQRG